ncbi:MAG: hypothetical protein ACK478_10350 [Flavobacteriales bacterium]
MQSRVESNQKEKRNLSYSTVYYDRKGRETAVYEFNADSVCTQVEFFEYNKKGKLTLQTSIDSVAHTHSRLEQRYDDHNLLIEKTLTTDGKLKERTVYTYNNLDDRTREQVFDESNVLKKETVFTYDFRGMLLRKTTTDGSGKIIYDKINRYDY